MRFDSRVILLPGVFAVGVFACFSAVAAAQNSNLSDHDRYIHQQSEYNTRYFNNADSYPKIDTAALAARIAASFKSTSRYTYTEPSSSRSTAPSPAVSSGPSEYELRRERERVRFDQLRAEIMRDDYSHLTELANLYYAGHGTEMNKELAYQLYRAASEISPLAAYSSALMIYTGDGVSKNEEIGIEAMRDAARLKSSDAVAWLSSHGFRPGVDLNQFKAPDAELDAAGKAIATSSASAAAVAEVRAKSDAGNPRAKFYLAQAYERGIGVAKDENHAYALYKEAAQDKNPEALYRLGMALWNAELGQKRYDYVGTHYLVEAKDLGNMQAMYAFGQAFSTGDHTLKLDRKVAAEFYLTAAERNFAPAEMQMATVYYVGTGVAKDDAKAALWARKALADGQPGGATLLAKLFAAGAGVPKDAAQSLAMMQRAAKAGDAEARTALAQGFNGTAVLASDNQLSTDAFAALPPLLERQMTYFHKTHDKLPKLSAKDFETLQKKYDKAKNGCETEPAIALQMGRYLLTPESSEETLVRGQKYLFCATMQKTPGALEEWLWTPYLRFYAVRKGNSYQQLDQRKFFGNTVATFWDRNVLAAYLRAGLEGWDSKPTIERASLLFAVAGGITEAETDLAAMEWDGVGGARDEAEGTKFMQDAANTDPYAMYLLGVAYANGLHGVPKDPKRGLDLLAAASASGVAPAKPQHDRLQAKIQAPQ